MRFLLPIIAALVAASLVVTAAAWLWVRGTPCASGPFWKRALLAHAFLIPFYALVVTPAMFALMASNRIGTRHDERAYGGPRIAADGTWVMQSRESLRAEREGKAPPADLVEAARKATVTFETEDGVTIRAFLVRPATGPTRATVVLVHGLFRGGLELETPASMFRDLGCEVLMVELRNHGMSARAPTTFGLNERRDVIAAVAWLRRAPERADRPLILFAVSLGTAAVMRAAPDIPNLSGLVLDAPMDDLLATAHRMLSRDQRAGRRSVEMPQPFRSLTFTAFEIVNGVRFADVRPIDDVARLPRDIPALVIGGEKDQRMPPDVVRAVFDRIPSSPDLKTLWIRPGSDHGQVWIDDPDGYRSRLAALLFLTTGS